MRSDHMEFMILDKSFQLLTIIDSFESAVWTDRYNQAGYFEVVMPRYEETMQMIKMGYYVICNQSDSLMILDTIEISSDPETGAKVTISGSSLELILDRRVIYENTTFDNVPITTAIATLLDKNIISPSDSLRKISNFTRDSFSGLSFGNTETQLHGESLYEIITKYCSDLMAGFRVHFDAGTNQFVFQLYKGVDRSYDQSEVPYVVFSPSFDNLAGSQKIQSETTLKNVVYAYDDDVYEEEVSEDQIVEHGPFTIEVSVGGNTPSGLDRREVYLETSGIQREIKLDDGTKRVLTDSEYISIMQTKAEETLEDSKVTNAFDGQVEITKQFVYGEDFFMGDIVQIEDEFGERSKSYVAEVVWSQDAAGMVITPTFVAVN